MIRGKFSKSIIPLLEQFDTLKKLKNNYTPKEWIQNTINILLEEHIKAWVEYNKLKHKNLPNLHNLHKRVTELKSQSTNYAFDPLKKIGLTLQTINYIQ